MGKNSKIAWTHHTANFWWGCQKVSAGCKNCYAEAMSKRLDKSIWGLPYTSEREGKKEIWNSIKKWDYVAEKKGERRRVFVQSMSDFLEDHPMVISWRNDAKKLLEELKWLDILILTKRPENALKFLPDWMNDWPSHIWFGVSVENQEMANVRIPLLLKVPASIRFLSVEPQLELIDFRDWIGPEFLIEKRIHWVINGGESGPGFRPFDWDWARKLRNYCEIANIPFFMKQGGGYPSKRETLFEIPEDLRIREMPIEPMQHDPTPGAYQPSMF